MTQEVSDNSSETLPENEQRWSWLEIDLSAIRHNVEDARAQLKPGTLLLAVVKADGYGHGAVECAQAAIEAGADYLGVATAPEAFKLREAGVTDIPLMIISQPPAQTAALLLKHNVMPTVYDIDFARAYNAAAKKAGVLAPYHMAVNTGMNRIGVRWTDVVEFQESLKDCDALQLVGTFTHFATADCPATEQFETQVTRFNQAISSLRDAGIDPGIVHAANSASIWRYPNVHFDMVRLGISLYGFLACPEIANVANLQTAMTVHARITDTRMVEPGDGVSYGLHYNPTEYERVCTVPIGYADGLRRGLSGNTNFIWNGKLCRQVGNICMDQCMFVVDTRPDEHGNVANPQVGDEVLIVGTQGDASVTITEMAEKLGTNDHEIAIGFAQRMPRIYV